jgi:hypothetical protein
MIEFKGRITYIYALMDEFKIKYIGKSDDPNKRLVYHIRYGKQVKNYKQNWVNKMIRENKEISLKILEVVPYEIWEEREMYWIAKYGLKNLVNGTVGGNSGDGQKYINFVRRDKNLKITSKTHDILKTYCKENELKIFEFVETLIKDTIQNKKDL